MRYIYIASEFSQKYFCHQELFSITSSDELITVVSVALMAVTVSRESLADTVSLVELIAY